MNNCLKYIFNVKNHNNKCYNDFLITLICTLIGVSASGIIFGIGTLVTPINNAFNSTNFYDSYGFFGSAIALGCMYLYILCIHIFYIFIYFMHSCILCIYIFN